MSAETTAANNIALCLSGGGLRATLFHLGLIKALRSHEIDGQTVLRRVGEIYSVSGGSILAAHLVRNWQGYCGDDASFAALERQILAFARRNLRDRVLRRWILSLSTLARGHLLQREYRALLGSGSVADCYADDAAGLPRLHILATSFKTGELCSFSGARFEIARRDGKTLTTITADGRRLPLAYAAAASSAFPPMFPPLALKPDMLGTDNGEDFREPLYLSDGGVYDNLGFEKFLTNHATGASDATMLIGSNAGGSFKTEAKSRFAGLFSRNVRASDIMMRRVLEGTEDAIQKLANVDYVPVKIGDTREDPGLASETQRELRSVRTDLDFFGPALAAMLVDHGYRIGAAVLAERGATSRPDVSLRPTSAAPANAERIIRTAAKRSFLSLALDFRDWTLPILWIVALSLSYGGFTIVKSYLDEQDNLRTTKANYDSILRNVERMDAFRDSDDLLFQREFDDIRKKLGILKEQPRTDYQTATEQAAPPAPTAPVVTAPVQEAPLPSVSYPQKIYIQFAGTLTREQIVGLNANLKAAGWNVQGKSGERLSSAAGLHEIRYSGNNEAAARALAETIDRTRLIPGTVTTRPLSIIEKDVLELWMSN